MKKNSYLIPISIIIAGILIGGAILYTSKKEKTESLLPPPPPKEENLENPFNQSDALAEKVKPIDEKDHIRGDQKAPVILIEFSDFQCPFCGRFHQTMKEILKEFEGKVKWVYRHFPLDSIHPQATPAALASECVATFGGNEAFWRFSDKLFENQNSLGVNLYQKLVKELGLNLNDFNSCFESKKYKEKIQAHLKDGIDSGVRGTPYSIIIAPNGNAFPIKGALSFNQIKILIEKALEVK
jgi:protein-disulfide isomerase